MNILTNQINKIYIINKYSLYFPLCNKSVCIKLVILKLVKTLAATTIALLTCIFSKIQFKAIFWN